MNVEHDSQNKILISHKGEMPKKIGMEARKELEALLDSKIYLRPFVKVVPDCRESPQRVRELNWHFQLEGLSEDQGTGEESTRKILCNSAPLVNGRALAAVAAEGPAHSDRCIEAIGAVGAKVRRPEELVVAAQIIHLVLSRAEFEVSRQLKSNPDRALVQHRFH
jgi:hypothetical protein